MRGSFVLAAFAIVACTPAPQQTDSTPATSPTPTPPAEGTRPDTALPASSDAEIALDRSSYSAADQLRMTIRSRTSDTLGFNPCNRLIERQDGSTWSRYVEPNRICTMELWLLEPQASRAATTELPAAIPKGTYRVVLLLGRQKTAPAGAPANWGTVRAVSDPFTIN